MVAIRGELLIEWKKLGCPLFGGSTPLLQQYVHCVGASSASRPMPMYSYTPMIVNSLNLDL